MFGRRSTLPPPPPSVSVLVVIDDEEQREACVASLSEMPGLVVEAVVDGRQALERLNGRAYALALVEQNMPPANERGLLRGLKALHPETALVAYVEGDLPPEEAAEYLHAGASHLLALPVTPERLRARVKAMLDAEARTNDRTDRFRHHLHAATLALDERQLTAASAHARQALSYEGARPEPFNVLGIVAQLSMDLAEAQRLYRTALALDPNFAPARDNLRAISDFPKKLSLFRV
ncbi:MAG: response regulator [Rhodothermales bacterium]|nr:response regulator [Rhodothermales bacterium]MCA0268860.1 response regulator [Bacteroidota bacterium]